MKAIYKPLAVIFALFSSSSCYALEKQQKLGIDKIFDEFKADTPGCILDVSENNVPIYTKAFGSANLEHNLQITENTNFLVGSVSKQFTATAIALLAESGKLALTDKLSKYFPDFPNYANEILLTDLIHHTSGIKDIGHLTYLGGFGQTLDYSTEDALRILQRQSGLNFEPGTQYMYSNSGYTLLAQIVEKVSGLSFREYTTENIFKPLGMTNTRFNDNHHELVNKRATGYWPSNGSFSIVYNTMDIVGSNGVYTSAADLRQWIQNFSQNKLGIGNTDLLTQLITPGNYRDGSSLHYAFGLEVDERNGIKRIHHGGGTAGYRAMLMMLPEKQSSLSLLCNNGWVNTLRLSEQVSDILFNYSVPSENVKESKELKDKSVKISQAHIGNYWSSDDKSSVKVSVNEGDPHYQINNRKPLRMLPIGQNSYEINTRTGIRTVKLNDNNISVAYERYGKQHQIVYRKVDPDPIELLNYIGDFYSPDLDITHKLLKRDEQLLIELKAADSYKLEYKGNGVFSSKSGQIVIEFSESNTDQELGFVLHSSRAKSIKFVKASS